MTNTFTCRICGMPAGSVRTAGGGYALAHEGTLHQIIVVSLHVNAPLTHVPAK